MNIATAIQIRTGIVITCVIGIGVISVLDGRTTPTVTLEQRPAAVTSTTAPSAPTTTTEAPTTTTTTKHIVRKSVTRSAAPAGMAATTTPNMPPEPIEQQHNIPDCPDYCVELEVTQ